VAEQLCKFDENKSIRLDASPTTVSAKNLAWLQSIAFKSTPEIKLINNL
jgi:hypothetical protein